MKEDDEKQGGEEYVIVEDDKNAAKPEPTGVDERERDEDDDERVSARNDDDDEREAIRERRRKERQERKERRQESISRDKLELDFLRKRNDELERRISAQEQRTFALDVNNIDAQIAKAQQEIEMAERVIAKAVAAGNGEDVTQAMRYRDKAFATANQLVAQKAQAAQRQVSQQPANTLDDRTLSYAKEFIEENAWYDPQGRDEDSAIVLAIDQGLVKDGYRTDTEEYWEELRRRAAKRLPERFERDAEPARGADRKPRGGPAVGSGREHAPASTRREIYISPERKQALIEAGVWDDPVLRMKYVKRYAEYDKGQKSSA
jgi:hypothetical protein